MCVSLPRMFGPRDSSPNLIEPFSSCRSTKINAKATLKGIPAFPDVTNGIKRLVLEFVGSCSGSCSRKKLARACARHAFLIEDVRENENHFCDS